MRVGLIDDDPVSLYSLRHNLPKFCKYEYDFFSINPKEYSDKFGIYPGYFKLFFDIERLNLDFVVSDFHWNSNFSLDGFLDFLNKEGSSQFDLPMVCISGSELERDITSYNNVLDKIETKIGKVLIPSLAQIIDKYNETNSGSFILNNKLVYL